MQELAQLMRNLLGEDLCNRIFGPKKETPTETPPETKADTGWPRAEPSYNYTGEVDPVQKSAAVQPNYEAELPNAASSFVIPPPTHDEIAARAATLNGDNNSNWFEAERQLKAEREKNYGG